MLRFVVLVAACLKLGDSQQCMPVTDMACESTWSEYTACLASDQDMMQGIASYKAQVSQMGCEVPLWYWQATVDSEMMRYRAGLIQYRKNLNLGPLEGAIRMPKMSRKKRQVDYEDDSEYVYQPVEVNNQVSAGCGFCARRIRCCKDHHQSWLDQNMQSDICEEYSDACQVPLMEDGSCDYALAMPKLMNDHINQNPGNNSVIGNRLVNRLKDKWMSLLGATEPSMYCTKNGLVCNCCCGNYTAEPTEQGDMVCRRRRGPSGCGPNEMYEECSTSCQATCMEPNPTGCNGDQCKSIYAGCKCKPGMVRYGVNCIMPSQCPASGSNSSVGNSNQNAATTMQGQGTTAAMPGGAAETTTVPGTTATSGGSGATTPSNSCKFSWSSPNNCQGAACQYQVTVTAPNPNNSATILVQLTAVGTTDGSDFWTGIGYSSTGKMAGSTATLLLVQSSDVVSVQDRSLGDGFLNPLDSNQNAYLISGSYNNGVLNATVSLTCQQNSDPVNVCKDTFYPLYPTAPNMMKSKDNPGYHMNVPTVSTTTYSFANCGV